MTEAAPSRQNPRDDAPPADSSLRSTLGVVQWFFQSSTKTFDTSLRILVAGISFAFFVVVFARTLQVIGAGKADQLWAPLQTMELYFAAAGAFLVVTAFRTIEGPIKFTFAKTFEFEGASGPILMWILVFLALCFGMHMLGFASQEALLKVPRTP